MSQPKKTKDHKRNQWGYKTNFTAAGVRYRRWFPTLDEAKEFQRLKEAEARAHRDGVPVKRAPLTLGQLFAAYSKEYNANPTRRGKRLLDRGHDLCETFGNEYKLTALRRSDLTGLVAQWRVNGYADGTCKTMHSVARAFLNYAHALFPDSLPDDWDAPSANFRRLATRLKPNKRRRVLTADELRKFWAMLNAPRQPRERATTAEFRIQHAADFFALEWLTGKRYGELCALEWHDVDFDQDYLKFTLSKTNSVQLLPMSSEARLILLRRKLRGEARPFPKRAYQDVPFYYKITSRRAGIPYGDTIANGWTQHDIRHTVATHAIRAGAHVPIVSFLLGHKLTTSTTDLYTNLADADTAATLELIATLWRQYCRDNDGTTQANPSISQSTETIKKQA